MKIHELKILPQYFNAVADGSKPFEIRKNDRGFKIGDKLILKEYRPLMNIENRFSGNKIEKEVSYILEGGRYGLEEGYCILGLEDIDTFKRYQHFNKIFSQEKSAEVQALEMILSGINEKLSLEYLSDEDFINYSNKFEAQIKWLNEEVEK